MRRALDSRQTCAGKCQRQYGGDGESGLRISPVTLGESCSLPVRFSFCEKCKNDADSLFHRGALGQLRLSERGGIFKGPRASQTAVLAFQGHRIFPTPAVIVAWTRSIFPSHVSALSQMRPGNLQPAGQCGQDVRLTP